MLNPAVIPPNYEIATRRLLYGYDQGSYQHKYGHRFQSDGVTGLLSDFDNVLAALYAEQNQVAIEFTQQCKADFKAVEKVPVAKIDRLQSIWQSILPHRELVVLAGNLKTKVPGGTEYSASEMSDGERVIFYLIAQALLAKPDTVLVFDEPELHINRSILPKLWDEIESARSDCAFVYITHDVEFASSRHAASKYALRSYQKEPSEAWDIELIPDEADIPDDVVATIIGSRQPVLFVEGDGGSLDSSLYRRAYDDFTVIPVGSCEQVIHTVASFIARKELHRVGCAGLVDADGRTAAEATYLESKGVYCLPVSEVENLLLLPRVFLALAEALKFDEAVSHSKLAALTAFTMQQATQETDAICFRRTKRQIDSAMKKIGLASSDVTTLDTEFKNAVAAIDAATIFAQAKSDLTAAIAANDYEKVLYYYDNKGLLAEVAKQVGYQQKALEEFVGRVLRSDENTELHTALRTYLPSVTPRP